MRCVRARENNTNGVQKGPRRPGKNLGDYISVDNAVFINCPSREGYRYVVQLLDYATKHSWFYPMTDRDEFIEKLRDFVDVKLRRYGAKIRHYHVELS